ncbi:Acyl dehydratase [Pseudomonas sessilinigenes]|nr:Acyl dehydratase [Pseudomonas sessilinigenes]
MTSIDDLLGPLWEARSRFLCRGIKLAGEPPGLSLPSHQGLLETDHWTAEHDIGRLYAKVSGNYNPIHLSAWSTRLFGFPQAIAHGLWSEARTLAALQEHLPTANLEITVRFIKPVLLPSPLRLLASAAGSSGELQLLGKGELQHMQGGWQPIA